MAITLVHKASRQPAINPTFRNDNLSDGTVAGSWKKDKLGVSPLIRISPTLHFAMPEGLIGAPGIAGNTNWCGLYQSTDRGETWVPVPGVTQPVFSPVAAAGAPELGEVCFTSIIPSRTLGLWCGYYHAGNNGAPRQIFLATAPINTALPGYGLEGPWTKVGVLLSASGVGDEAYEVSDAGVVKVSESSWCMMYRGHAGSGTAKIRGCGATATDPRGPWTKIGTLIDVGAAGQWDDEAIASPALEYRGGRFFAAYAGGDTPGGVGSGVGLAWADAFAGPWTKSSANPIWIKTSNVADYDGNQVGDTAAWLWEQDIIRVHAGAFNNSASMPLVNGSNRFEGRIAAIIPRPVDGVPTRGGRHYGAPQGELAANRQYSSLSNTIIPVNTNAHTILIEFKAPKGNTVREFFTSEASSSLQCYFRIRADGTLEAWHRSGANIAQILGASRVDDNKRRWAMFRRTAANAFDVYSGDESGSTLVGTYTASSPALSATAPFNAFGNWHPSAPASGGANEPAIATLADCAIVIGGTISPADALAWFNSRTVPTPSGGTMYRWAMGGSATATEPELGGSGLSLTHTGSPNIPAQVEWTEEPNMDLSPIVTASGRHTRRTIAARRRHAA